MKSLNIWRFRTFVKIYIESSSLFLYKFKTITFHKRELQNFQILDNKFWVFCIMNFGFLWPSKTYDQKL